MNNYSLMIRALYIEKDSVIACIEVLALKEPSYPLLKLDVEVERKDGYDLATFETLTLKKAASLIHCISNELMKTA
ncbi:hypothetical protein P3X16_000026 [Cronobacter dublinensis]|uniref:hypothetical protein n=1 Tax=Cronobacter universalis TaxID=535744 RepID=UPI003CFAD118|nr:hypothetical protein [Cronobacter dublinensis]